MFQKTSCVEFLEFGEVFSDGASDKQFHESNHILPVQTRDLIYMYHANHDIYLRTLNGICLLVVTKDINSAEFKTFVIHRTIKINAGIYFNFISLSDKTNVEMAFLPDTIIRNYFFKHEFQYNHIRPNLQINELVAYYYNVRGSNYQFSGEKQQFWEFTYVDSGTLYTTIENTTYELHSNQCIFYAPGQYHKQHTRNEPCSYLTVVYDMNAIKEYTSKLIGQIFTMDRDAKRALDSFVTADDKLSFYDKEMMILSMQRIMLCILRSTEESTQKIASTPMQQKFENELLEQIVLYINENIYTPLNVEELCDAFAISRSSLQSLFRHNVGVAPKEYISALKLKKSKELIKESKYTISEITSILGFSSIHYFSRRFKQEFGINPTDYAKKII